MPFTIEEDNPQTGRFVIEDEPERAAPSLRPVLESSPKPLQDAERIRNAITNGIVFDMPASTAYALHDQLEQGKQARGIDLQKLKGQSTLALPKPKLGEDYEQSTNRTMAEELAYLGEKTMRAFTHIPKAIGIAGGLPGRALGLGGGVWDSIFESAKNAQDYWQPEMKDKDSLHYLGEALEQGAAMGVDMLFTYASGGLYAPKAGTQFIGLNPNTITSLGMAIKNTFKEVFKSPLGLMGARSGLEKQREIEDNGFPLYKSLIGGLVQGGLEITTEKLPIDELLKPGTAFITRLLKGMVYDVPGELASTAGEMSLIDEYLLGGKYTKKQYYEALHDTAIISLLMTGGMTTAIHPFVSQKPEVAALHDGVIDGLNAMGYDDKVAKAAATEFISRTDDGQIYLKEVQDTIEQTVNRVNEKSDEYQSAIEKIKQEAQTQNEEGQQPSFPKETLEASFDNLMEQDLSIMTDDEIFKVIFSEQKDKKVVSPPQGPPQVEIGEAESPVATTPLPERLANAVGKFNQLEVLEKMGITEESEQIKKIVEDAIKQPMDAAKLAEVKGKIDIADDFRRQAIENGQKLKLADGETTEAEINKIIEPKSITESLKDLNDAIGEKGTVGKGTMDIDKVKIALFDIGHTIYQEGKTTLQTFTERMKEITDNAWSSVKQFVKGIWNAVKAFNERLGEKGAIKIGKEDTTLRDAANTVEKIIKEGIFTVEQIELGIGENLDLSSGESVLRANEFLKEHLTEKPEFADFKNELEKQAANLKSILPGRAVKKQIGQATGQTPSGKMVTEEQALRAAMIKAARSAREAYRAGNKAGGEKYKAHFVELAQRRFEHEQLKKVIKDLKRTAEKLSESPSVSADYRNKINKIIGQYELSGHTEETINRLKATQEYIDRAKAKGEDVEIPQRILDKLKILGRIPKDQLTLDVAMGLKNEIALLGKLGKTKWASKQALYEAEKEARKEALLGEAAPINSFKMDKQTIGAEPRAWIERFIKLRNFLQKNRLSLRPIDGIADITGMKAMKESLDAAFNNYLTYNDEAFNEWIKLTNDFTQGQYEKIGAYAMAQQEGGMERLENSGYTKAEIEAIKLTKREAAAYQFVRERFEKEFPAVRKYALDIYNKDVGQVDNYVSFMSDYQQMSDLEMWERFGQNSYDVGGMKTKTVEQGFTKSRAGMSPIKLELNIDKIFIRHMDDVAYMITMGRDIKQYFEIVNSPEMKAKLGDVGSLAWLQWLDLMARKGGSEGAKRIAAIDTLRRNMGAGILAFRISSFMVQVTSFADTIATVGTEYATKGASHIATSKEWRSFIMDNFPEIKKAVGDDIAFREFGNSMFAKLTQKGLVPLQYLDGLMRTTAAAAAYQKLADAKGIEVDLQNPDKALIQDATRLMRDSQGSSFFKDQPLAITTNYGLTGNRSINKMILQFQGFMLNRWENTERQIWRMGIKERDFSKAFMSFFWLIIVSATLEEGIRRGTRAIINLATGDVEKEKSFTGQVALQAVQSVPLAGQIISSATYASNPVPVIKATEDAIGGVGSVIYGKEAMTKVRGGVRALGAVGSLSGVPGSSQASQIVNKSLKKNKSNERR